MAIAGNGLGPGTLVLMGFAEAYAAIETAWSLQEAGYRVAAFERAGERSALRRVRQVDLREVTAPEHDARRTVDDVGALIRSLRPAAYLPLDDGALWLAGQLDRDEVVVAGPTGSAVEYALDKDLQIRAAREAGLHVPATRVVQSVAEVTLPEEEYPVVVKPSRAVSCVDGRLVRPTGKSRPTPPSWPASPTTSGTRRCSSSRSSMGPARVCSAMRPLTASSAGARTGGFAWSTRRDRRRRPAPRSRWTRRCSSRRRGFSGRSAGEGCSCSSSCVTATARQFMELNGRAWGSLALARRRGFEYPAWTVGTALDGGFAAAVPERPPAIVCRHLGMELVHLAFVLRGPSSTALDEWPRFWPTIRDLVRVRRGERLYNWKRSQPDVLLADTAEDAARLPRQDDRRPAVITVRAAAHVHSEWSYDATWTLPRSPRRSRSAATTSC